MYPSPSALHKSHVVDMARANRRINKIIDQAAAKFFKSVYPIYGVSDKGAPDQIGSAIILEICGDKILLTAAHVVDAKSEMGTELYLGAEVNNFVHIDTKFFATLKPDDERDKDQYDFAFSYLSDKAIDNLGPDYITESDISIEVPQNNIYTAIGYPNSKNRRSDPKTKKTVARKFKYSSIWRFNEKMAKKLVNQGSGEDHIFIDYRKHSRSNGIKVSSVAPRGLSGGAIIDTGCQLDLQFLRGNLAPLPRIVGMTVERWKEHQVLVGTRMSVILREISNRAGCK